MNYERNIKFQFASKFIGFSLCACGEKHICSSYYCSFAKVYIFNILYIYFKKTLNVQSNRDFHRRKMFTSCLFFIFWYFVLYFIKYRFSTYFSFSFSLLFFLVFFFISIFCNIGRKEIFSRN